ncbi:glycosyltransferase family A protein [Hyphomicrobium sp.]|uniref:glycosyltransferase family 2 protein n=1 Tax=Hyphomicrobium sp. TaxID=82 RepID=UPI0025C182CF|nr:glycosyltransferase family A protein [Hyphomicrobium sp.]MCC7251276.1 glycosyltransferase family 2 protein [Hyphomicrobium sp.]
MHPEPQTSVALGTQELRGADGIDFAVVIPAFNRAATIGEAIESVLRQTVAAKEIIVVDDASTDDTVQRVRAIGSPLVKVLVNARNLGATASRNRGAKAVTAEWIAFLDSDDYWHPDKLAAEHALIAAGGDGVTAVASNHVLVIDDKICASPTRKERIADVAGGLMTENFLGTCSCMTVKREPFVAIGGFNEQLKSCQDWDLWLRAAHAGRVLISTPPHVFYRLNTRDCISGDGRKRQSGHTYIWKSHIRQGRDLGGDRVMLALTFADVCCNRNKWKSFRRLCRYVLWAEPQRFRQVGAMLWHGATSPDYLTYRRRMEQSLEFMNGLRSRLRLRRSAA